MNYQIKLSMDVTVVVNVRKPLLGKHPLVSSELYYCGSKLYSRTERTFWGLSYDHYQDHDALLEAMVLLGGCFRTHEFVYDEFPCQKVREPEFLFNKYPSASFPAGSTFEVEEFVICRSGGDVYYILNNSVAGRMVASYEQLCKFPNIIKNYKRIISDNEICIGFLSSRIIGKRFEI